MKPQKPNILWLCSDQQRYDTIRALGCPWIDTPNLDRLCAQGVALTSAYSQSPVCTPSRASFLTGRYPSAVNANLLGGTNLPEHCTLLPRALADAGYLCGNIGKLHINTAWGGHERRGEDGYSEFYYNLAPGHDLERGESAYRDWLTAQGIDWRTLFTKTEDSDFYWYREDTPAELRQTAWCAEMAVDFIRRHRNETWMLSVNCFDPHPPFDAPRELVEKYLSRDLPEPIFSAADVETANALSQVRHRTRMAHAPDEDTRRKRASYYGMVELVDRHFGRIIDELDRLGLRENTLVIFTSDHGEMLGDHGLMLKGCRFYEGAVRVPLIFSLPGTLREGFASDTLVELTDIAPTVAELAGVPFPRVEGRSLMPLCALKPDRPYVPREFVRSEYYDAQIETPQDSGPTYATMYRDRRYKLVAYHTVDYGELYDLENDPGETHNLWMEPEALPLVFELTRRAWAVSELLERPGQTRAGRY